jgi:hypothetical protein
MAKRQTGESGMPNAQREEAVALLTAIRSGNHAEKRKAAHRIVETALYWTQIVEWAWYLEKGPIRETSKNYPRFPILLSGRGHDAQQKLNRIEDLPIAANTPFKRIRGAARCDDIRTWIESAYEVFEHVQIGSLHSVGPIAPALVETIQSLPELRKPHARQWAEVMVRHRLEGPGGEHFLRALGINLSGETKKRERLKNRRMRDKFGGDRLEIIPGDTGPRFIAHSGDVARGKELDSITASHFEHRIKHPPVTEPTSADAKNALIDRLEKRIVSILK